MNFSQLNPLRAPPTVAAEVESSAFAGVVVVAEISVEQD